MKIALYCQHVLGIGHVHRSMEICRALARLHDVTMITGGAPLKNVPEAFSTFQLPGLMMDTSFNNLAPVESSKQLEDIKIERKNKLYEFFQRQKPDIFLVELYPFGRKAFRFELDPILTGIKNGKLPPCMTVCSVRDILVERSDAEKFEARIIATLNAYFDGVLIHGDEELIALNETFSRMKDIAIPTAYTGYVTPQIPQTDPQTIRSHLGLADNCKLIVASIGGGNVGGELLFRLVDALRKHDEDSLFLQVFTGPYATARDLGLLQQYAQKNISIDRFTPNFPEWLLTADLSISMAGYNTIMNILAAGIPALVYPFSHNQEQTLRIDRLKNVVPIRILRDRDLEPKQLLHLILQQLTEKRYRSPVDLNGSANSCTILQKWYSLAS